MNPLKVLEKNQTLTRVITLAYIALIFLGSHQPTIPDALSKFTTYGIIHVAEYLLLALLLVASLKGCFEKVFLTAFVFATIYGFTDEVHQSFIPGRDVSLLDVLSDCVGAAVGVSAYMLTDKFLEE